MKFIRALELTCRESTRHYIFLAEKIDDSEYKRDKLLCSATHGKKSDDYGFVTCVLISKSLFLKTK